MNERELQRRRVLLGAATVAAGAWAASGSAAPAAAASVSTTLSRNAGSLEIVALLDASGPFPASWESMFPNASPRDWQRARLVDPEAFGDDGYWHLDFHCFAVRRPGGRITLIDSGVGPVGSPASGWAPVPGDLPRVLTAAGIDAQDVDLVVMTHLHEDHVGWAVLPDGRPMFPNAGYVVQRDEVVSLEQTPDSAVWGYVVEPLRRAGQLCEIDGVTRLPGGRWGESITAIPTPGHTVGHQSVVIDGGRRQIIVTGDVLVHAVQLVNPDVSYHFEQDKVLAADTRRRLVERAGHRRALLATAHLNRPFICATEGG